MEDAVGLDASRAQQPVVRDLDSAHAWHCCWIRFERREWFEIVSTAEDEVAKGSKVDWWRQPWFKAPTIRQTWGEAQQDLESGAQELFLDLIFVGVADRVGTVINSSYATCMYEQPAAMRHLQDSRPLPPCSGLGAGLLRGLTPFVGMYLLWCVTTQHKARYSCSSKLHTLLDLLFNLLLVYAAMSLSPNSSSNGPLQGTTCVDRTLRLAQCMLTCYALCTTDEREGERGCEGVGAG